MTTDTTHPVRIEPTPNGVEFNLMMPSESDGDLFSFLDDASDSDGSSVPAESLFQAKKYLTKWLKDNSGDEMESAVGKVLDDIDRALDSVEWDSDDTAAFLVGDWGVMYGSPSWSVAKAVAENSTSTLEATFSDRLIAFKPNDDGKGAIRSNMREGGVEMTARLNEFLGGNKTSVGQAEESAELARSIGFSVPDVFPSGRSLKLHQEIAALSLAVNGGGLLADQVGLGKGGEFTCAWETFKNYHVSRGRHMGPCVVSVTKSMVDEIAKEIMMWVDDPTIVILQGRKESYIDPDVDYILLNHDILAYRVDEIIDMHPSGFIADECHVFKNETAARTKAAIQLSKHIIKSAETFTDDESLPIGAREGSFICMASGTPFLNQPMELWSILKVIGVAEWIADYAKMSLPEYTEYWRRSYGGGMVCRKGKMSSKRAFEIYFCNGHYDKYHNWWAVGASHIEELNELLITNASMVRRRKSDVMRPMPSLTENVVYTELSEEHTDMYKEAANNFYNFYLDRVKEMAIEEGISVDKALGIATKKLDIASMFMQIGELRKIASNGKPEAAIKWIDDFLQGRLVTKHADGSEGPVSDDPTRRKLIVFVHFRDTRAEIMESELLSQYNPVYILPGGEMSGDEIQEAKRAFQEDDDVRLIICSMAAREGHTLTAAKDVLVVDMPYTPSWVVQIAGRCWARFSELYDPHEAYVHYMIAEDTIDKSILRKSRMKKKTFDAIIDNEGTEDLTGENEMPTDDLLASIVDGIVEVGIAK